MFKTNDAQSICCFGVIEYRTLQYLSLQEAALKLGMLTSEEFDTLVVPEKMIGPTD